MSDDRTETDSAAETQVTSTTARALRERFAEWMDEPETAEPAAAADDDDRTQTQVIPAFRPDAATPREPKADGSPTPPAPVTVFPLQQSAATRSAAEPATPPAAPAPGRRRRVAAETPPEAAPREAETPAAPRAQTAAVPMKAPSEPIPVPPEFFAPEPASPDDAETEAEESAPKAPIAPRKTSGTVDSHDETSEGGGGFRGAPRWQEHVPFDETGVLLRPESLRAKAMHEETELISAIKIDEDSEAAKAQSPGFWTGAWPRRALVALIMAVQAVLSLRNNNSPFVDESLYLYSGHLELGQMLHGTATNIDFWSYFSGAPVLYPPLGALADQIGGIFAARLLSLIFMLGTTGLLYLLTRRMFGTRAGLCAAALFSCTEPAIYLGGLATYDAPALFLLALAAWLVVRFAASTSPLYLLAIFPASIAVGTKYVSLLFVPTIFVLALLAAAPYFRGWALIRPIALSIGTGILLYTGYKLAGTTAASGISATTTSRAHGTDSISLVMKQAGQFIGVGFVIAVIGGVFLVRLPRTHAQPAVSKGLWPRVALAVLLAGTALLAPLYQAHLHTATSLGKHVGFGLFFAAPLAGYGLVRIVGPHLHRVQLGIGVLVLSFALGMGQSLTMYHAWPNTYAAVAELVKYQKPGAHYLFADGPNVIYLLRGDRYVEPSQVNDAFYFGWWDEKGKFITGEPAYADAIQAGYFQVVSYDFSANPAVEQSIAQDLYNSPIYKLAAKIYAPTSAGPGWSYVWVRK